MGILNITRGVLSSNENYLLFGANCSENSKPVERFLNHLAREIDTVENKTYVLTHNGQSVNVKFYIAELPNDMKMLSFITGELSNSAKYFSSFADVTKENGVVINGTFGKEEKNTWHPWNYNTRLKVAKEVETLKKKISKQKLAETTKRNKITTFISSQNSRQEFIPPLGPVIERIHVDPLHLKNNVCALLHQHLLELVLKVSVTNHIVFSQIPSKSPFARYVKTLRTKCDLSRLAKKIIRWFNESRSKEKKFDYRFTGKDSRMFVHNFMFLISSVDSSVEDPKAKQHLHAICFLCLVLRDCISLFSRVSINSEQVIKLERLCRTFYRVFVLIFNFHPSVWTQGFIVPAHTKDMFGKYGLGLSLNSMEGREAKHVSIARYCRNTEFNSRWPQIFMHEHISLLWLRERGHNQTGKVATSGLTYEPKRTTKPEFCKCGFHKDPSEENCKYCSHPLRLLIIECDKQGKLLKLS